MSIQAITSQSIQSIKSFQKTQTTAAKEIVSAASDSISIDSLSYKSSKATTESTVLKNIEARQQTSMQATKNIKGLVSKIETLSIRATDGLLSESDKALLSQEAESLRGEIQDNIQNSQFNGQKVLDNQTYSSSLTSFKDLNGSDIASKIASLDLSDLTNSQTKQGLSSIREELSQEEVRLGSEMMQTHRQSAIQENYASTLETAKENIQNANALKAIQEFSASKVQTEAAMMVHKASNLQAQETLKLLDQ